MDRNNNEVRNFYFFLSNTIGIFVYWLLAIIQTVCPFIIKRKSINGEIILITGAGAGIGQLMAIEFAKLGAIIVAWDINDAALAKTKRLVEENGSKCFIYNVDVSNKHKIYEAADKVKQDVGTVFMLINNAGIVVGKDFLDLKDEEIERTMSVNAMAHFYTYKAFLPDMVKRNHGHLVCISSLAGACGVNKLSDYCASKFAAAGFEESIRIEMHANGYEGVKSTVIMPWYINTGMFDGVKVPIPLLDPKYAVERIVDGVLKDQMIVMMPRLMYILIFMKSILPTEAGKCLLKLTGADKSMIAFKGKKQ